MAGKEKGVGYTTEDGNIHCVACINKDSEMMKKIDEAITADDSEEGLFFCEECRKEIK